MAGMLADMIYGYDPEELNIEQLIHEIYHRRNSVIRLEELKAPEIIVEEERRKYLDTIRVLLKYMDMNEIERLVEEKNPKFRKKR